MLLLKPGLLPPDLGSRFAFGIGILALCQHVPESPRWLIVHGRADERPASSTTLKRKRAKGESIWTAMANQHRKRFVLGFTLMVTQAFFYKAVLFT